MIKDIRKNAARIAEETIYLFKYKDEWLTDRELVKETKNEWTNVKTNVTKYNILRDPRRWKEVPFAADGDQAAAILSGNHHITTNGVIVTFGREMFTKKLTVSIMVDGTDRTYNISDLLYHGFLNREYDPTSNMTVINNFRKAMEDNVLTLTDIDLKTVFQGKKVAVEEYKRDSDSVETKHSPKLVSEFELENIELRKRIKELEDKLNKTKIKNAELVMDAAKAKEPKEIKFDGSFDAATIDIPDKNKPAAIFDSEDLDSLLGLESGTMSLAASTRANESLYAPVETAAERQRKAIEQLKKKPEVVFISRQRRN